MIIDVDLTKVPKLQPLPTGTYLVRITEITHGESQAGFPKLTFACDVIEPANVAEEIPKWYFSLSLKDTALFRVRELFEAVGKLHAGGFDTDELLGEVVGVTLRLEENEVTGRPQNQLVGFLPVNNTNPAVA